MYLISLQALVQIALDQLNPERGQLATQSLESALENVAIPDPAKEFMQSTFDFIHSDKPHVIAAAFALGREHIVPEMFQALLNNMGIPHANAAIFYYYLDRHIELDTDEHGPMSLKMLELLCEDDAFKIKEAEQAALAAIRARIEFWDGVLEAIKANKRQIA